MATLVVLIVTICLATLLWIRRRKAGFNVLKENGIIGPEPDFFSGNLRGIIGEKNVPRQGNLNSSIQLNLLIVSV